MGFFSGLGDALQRGFSPDNIAMSQALLAGDYGAVGQMQARRRQLQQQAQQQQAEADREQGQLDDQVWGMKELGYSLPEISAMGGTDRSGAVRARIDPYTLSPGARRTAPGIGGAAEQVTTAPTTMEQEAEALGRVNPALRESRYAKEALIVTQGTDAQGRPISIAADPRTLFRGEFAPAGQPPPQLPTPAEPAASAPTAIPQSPAAAAVPPTEAPAFAEGAALIPDDLSNNYPVRRGVPPVASYRGVEFGNPLANMPNLNRRTRNAPRRGQEAGNVPLVRTAADYNRLRSGAQYRLPDGSVRRKR